MSLESTSLIVEILLMVMAKQLRWHTAHQRNHQSRAQPTAIGLYSTVHTYWPCPNAIVTLYFLFPNLTELSICWRTFIRAVIESRTKWIEENNVATRSASFNMLETFLHRKFYGGCFKLKSLTIIHSCTPRCTSRKSPRHLFLRTATTTSCGWFCTQHENHGRDSCQLQVVWRLTRQINRLSVLLHMEQELHVLETTSKI